MIFTLPHSTFSVILWTVCMVPVKCP